MHITSLEVKNFRCFTSFKHTFIGPLILIEGPNGSGKTSLLEALHYACYGKSFRTNTPEELIQHASDIFFIKLELQEEGEQHVLQLGFSKDKKSIRINGKKITTYKELLHHYRAITITEDDILIIKGSPDQRRSFLDQAVLLHHPHAAASFKLYRKILKQRTALLLAQTWDNTSFELWTEQLWQIAQQITHFRLQLLHALEQETNRLLKKFFPEFNTISLLYKPSCTITSWEQWVLLYSYRERQAQRTLFGPHIDDFEIIAAGKMAKTYASRGQQKLLAVLLKIAHFSLITQQTGKQAVILLDDFMTDFDDNRAYALIDLLIEKKANLICTVPTQNSSLALHLHKYGAQHLKLELDTFIPLLQTPSPEKQI